MDVMEARSKLQHYADTYGNWIKTLPSEEALAISRDYGKLASQEPVPQQKHPHLIAATQFESIAECLKTIHRHEQTQQHQRR